MPWYDIRRGSFTTVLTTALSQFYGRRIRNLNRKKRRRGIEINIDDIERRTIEESSDEVRYGSYAIKADGLPESTSRTDVLTSRISMIKLYSTASPELRTYLRKWFFNKATPDHIRITVPFRKARREFLKLAPKFSIGISDCRILLEDRRKKALS